MNISRGTGRRQRRLTLVAAMAASFVGMGIAIAAAPATSRGPAASTPARGVTPANKATAQSQYEKAQALYDKGKYADAQVENEKALNLDPSHIQATLLRGYLQKQLAGGGATAATVASGMGGAAPRKVNPLTLQQVNLIRAMEMNSNDRPTGRFEPKVLEDFWNTIIMKDAGADKSRASHDRFLNASNFPQQLQRIKESNDIKYLQNVNITSDPAVIQAFKSNGGPHIYALQNCATAECHASGGTQGGNFHLLNPAAGVEQPYTNFYILSMYANKDGKMIDRDNTEKSLLLQYGLPYANATIKHPKIEARRLTGLADVRLRNMNDWIKALAFPKPNYGIVYEVPGTAPASQPRP